MPMIGDMAPAFHAASTKGEVEFPEDYSGKWVILFTFQADFTPVDTTELMTIASIINEFNDRNTQVIGMSTDTVYTHIAWLRKIKELVWKDIKHTEITFPIIADTDRKIAVMYGLLQSDSCSTQMVRSVFIIDPMGKIRAILYYPELTGRNIQEIIRIISALQKSDREGVMTPAGWLPGEDILLLAPDDLGVAAERMEKVNEKRYCLDWFLCFQQPDDNPDIQEKEKEPELNPFPSAYPVRRRMNGRR